MVISNRKVCHQKHIISGLFVRLEIRMECPGIETIRSFEFYHMFNGFLLGMRHGHLGWFIFKPVNNALQSCNFFLLRIVIFHHLIVVFFFPLHEIGVIARITGRCAVLNLVHHVHHIVQKHTVM